MLSGKLQAYAAYVVVDVLLQQKLLLCCGCTAQT
jgi:hypothetical protein